MKAKIFTTFMLFLLITNSKSFGNYFSIPTWNENIESLEVNAEPVKNNFLNLEAESAILIEQNTGKILFEKNSHEQLRPASVTKIMTILLIMEAIENNEIDYSTQIPCSENAMSMGGSQIWLDASEKLTVDEMLKAICVVSANDCTVAMAEYLAGSEELFVQKMNDKAKELGMNDTCFKNCHGIDEDGHLTSSYDISLMSKELLEKYPEITKYTTIWMDSLRDGASELVNTNKLIRTYEGCTGLKTGSTSLALYNLSASATRNGMSLIAVVLRAPTPKLRFSEAKLLLDYGFTNFKYIDLTTKDDLVQTIDIEKGSQKKLNLVYESTQGIIVDKKLNSEITQEIIINENIEIPINKGSTLGKVNFYIDNELVQSANLIASENISKKSFINIFKSNLNNWFYLLKT